MLQVTEARYEDDIFVLPNDLLSSTCTKVCYEPASDQRIHGSLLKEDTACKVSVFAALLLPFHGGIQMLCSCCN